MVFDYLLIGECGSSIGLINAIVSYVHLWIEDKYNDVLCFVSWYDSIFVMYSRQSFCYIGSVKTGVALTLIDLLKTFIRFKIKDFKINNEDIMKHCAKTARMCIYQS